MWIVTNSESKEMNVICYIIFASKNPDIFQWSVISYSASKHDISNDVYGHMPKGSKIISNIPNLYNSTRSMNLATTDN